MWCWFGHAAASTPSVPQWWGRLSPTAEVPLIVTDGSVRLMAQDKPSTRTLPLVCSAQKRAGHRQCGIQFAAVCQVIALAHFRSSSSDSVRQLK